MTITASMRTNVLLGRIYADVVLGVAKWRWAINGTPEGLPPPHNCIATTLEDAKAAFKQRYVTPAMRWKATCRAGAV